MPFMEDLDWEAITDALAEFIRKLMPEASGLMAKTGHYLIGRIEEKKALRREGSTG